MVLTKSGALLHPVSLKSVNIWVVSLALMMVINFDMTVSNVSPNVTHEATGHMQPSSCPPCPLPTHCTVLHTLLSKYRGLHSCRAQGEEGGASKNCFVFSRHFILIAILKCVLIYRILNILTETPSEEDN